MSALRMWLARLAGSFGRARRERDLADELEAHLQLEIDEYLRAGLSPAEARRRALIHSGGMEAAKEAYRDQRSLPVAERLVRSLQHAGRALRRSPGFSSAVIVSLALGVGANTSLFTIFQAVLLRPLPFGDPQELVSVGTTFLGWQVISPDVDAWRRESRSITELATVSSHPAAVSGHALTEFVDGAIASSNLLQVLRIRTALGRWFSEDEERDSARVVVLSQALWRRQFAGDTGVIGQMLRVDGSPRTVVGVLAEGTGLPLDAQLWLPGNAMLTEVVARRHSGLPRDAARNELERLSPSIANLRKHGTESQVVVTSLHDRLYGTARPALRLLFGAVLLLLLLACVNVANLSLARTLERRRELAMRATLGASRWSLTLDVLAENVLLATGGAGLGALAALWTTRFFVRLSPADITQAGPIAVNAGSLLFAGITGALVSLLVSVGPAVAALRMDLQLVLGQGGARAGRGRVARRVRRTLVVGQLALALLLIVGAGLLLRSMSRLMRADLGFRAGGVAVASITTAASDRYETTSSARRLFDDLEERLRGLPGVQEVTFGEAPLVAGTQDGVREGFSMIFSIRRAGQDSANTVMWANYVDAGYLATFHIPLLAGRGILATDDSTAPAVAVVTASAARILFGTDQAVGRALDHVPPNMSRGRDITVVGVVRDVRQRDVAVPAVPEVLLPVAQQDVLLRRGSIALRTTGDPDGLIRSVRRLLREVDPDLATTRLTTMQSVVDASLAPRRFLLLLMGAFAALAMALAVLGLYAVVSYLVARRTQEIGVRMALGATRADVRRLVLGEGARLVAIGIAVGAPAAYVLSQVLTNFLYEVEPHDGFTFAVAPLALAAAALLASWGPARRATRVDPASTLRLD